MAYGGNTISPPYRPDQYSEPETRFNRTLTSVPIDEANIEAEGGETALVTDVNGLPAHYNIEGPRHSEGGVPLNMPDNSFIYSDTAKMKIKDPEILQMFDYSDAQIQKIKKSRGITPADIAKKYDINKYRELLQDKSSNKIQRNTAELNIKNANLKLAQLALYQESMKGFPDGIPTVALPFISKFGIDPSSFLPVTEESVQQAEVPQEGPAQQEISKRNGGPTDPPVRSTTPNLDALAQANPENNYFNNINLGPTGASSNAYVEDAIRFYYDNGRTNFAVNTGQDKRGNPLYTTTDLSGLERTVNSIEDENLRMSALGNMPGPISFNKGNADLNLSPAAKRSLGQESYFDPAKKDIGSFGALMGRMNPLDVDPKELKMQPINTVKVGPTFPGAKPNCAPEGRKTPKSCLAPKSYGGFVKVPQEMMGPPMAENGLAVNDLLKFLGNYQTGDTKQPDVLVDKKAKLNFKTVGPYDADIMLAGLDVAGNVIGSRDDRKRENEFRKRTQADYLYTDTVGNEGDYDVNTGEFKPSQKYRDPVQFTGAATYSKYGGGLRKFVYEDGGEFNPELGVYVVYKNGREVYMDANDITAPNGWSPNKANRIPEARYGMQVAQTGAQKKSMYSRVEETFRGNEKLKNLLYEKTLAALKNEQYLNKDALKRKGVDINQAIAELTPEKALEAFLALQKRNYGVVENKGASWLRSQSQSDSKAYDDAYAELNLGAADPLNVALGQAAYLGYRDLLADRDAGLLEDDVNTDLAPYIVRQVGKQDESYGFDPENDISRIDAFGTNTTVGQLAGIVEPEPEVEPEEPDPIKDIPPGTIGEPARPTPPVGPYPQDVLSMGEAFANRMDIEKYYPWAPKVEPVIPKPTFFDPRRAEANIMGSYNTAINQLGAFASPQFLAANAASVAGTAMSAAADTIAQVQNQNVNVANQFETQRASILNNANLTNAAQAKQLYDQTTMMNQQYDNSKRDARNKLLGTIKNTVTNMATTDVINDVYGNRFMINPTKGGRLDFYNPPSTISPAQQAQTKAEQFAAIREQLKGTNISDEALLKIVFGTSDTPISTQDTDALAALSGMPRKYGGGVRRIKLKRAPK